MNAMPMPVAAQVEIETEEELPPSRRIISCRFGDVEIGEDNVILFQRGMLGFEGRGEYAVINLPSDRTDQFKFLQSLSDPALGFIVTEIASAADAINPDDLFDAYKHCEVSPNEALSLLIVSVRRGESGIEMTANLRAPIIINMTTRTGRQHVMPNGRYPIRHPL